MNTIAMSENESYERLEAAHQLASTRVEECIANPAKYLKDPVTLLCAEFKFENQPLHQCYWNNRFCIAIMCELDDYSQRVAAWCAVSNGLNGYWEWRTHSGYDMAAVLKYLGVVADDFIALKTHDETHDETHGGMYCTLTNGIAAKLVEKFRLPTARFRMESGLGVEEHQEREAFNKKYPYLSVL